MAYEVADEPHSELAKLRSERQQYETRLSEQARELNLLRARFARYETALRGSHVTVYTQDRDLRYTSISNPMFGRAIDDIVGRADEEIFPLETSAAVVVVKRTALTTGEAQSSEIKISDGGSTRWHDLHVEPLRNGNGEIVGLTCA